MTPGLQCGKAGPVYLSILTKITEGGEDVSCPISHLKS